MVARSSKCLVASRVAALLAAVSAAAPGVAADIASHTVVIEGVVPVVCRASVDVAVVPAAEGELKLGRLTEFCNNGSGYRVYADYSPELAKATLLVDGAEVELDDGGSTLISSSDAARIASRDVALSVPDGVAGGTLSFRIVPL